MAKIRIDISSRIAQLYRNEPFSALIKRNNQKRTKNEDKYSRLFLTFSLVTAW
jgi:hypothetical protein